MSLNPDELNQGTTVNVPPANSAAPESNPGDVQLDPEVLALLNQNKAASPVEVKSEDKPEVVELEEKIHACLKEHGNQESNIPYNHDFWTWRNRWRYLKSLG